MPNRDMKSRLQVQIARTVYLVCFAAVCGKVFGQTQGGSEESSDARIDAVILAQTHVMKPDQPYFELEKTAAPATK